MTDPLAALLAAGFDVAARNHAAAILSVDFPAQTAELAAALLAVRIPVAEIVASGGGEAPSTRRLRRALAAAGWPKHVFRTEISVDGAPREAASHEVDHVRRVEGVGSLALEIEWNNKDPFFDRDLENFQRLHGWNAISAGVLVTRGAALQAALPRLVRDALEAAGVSDEAGVMAAFDMKDRTARQRETVARRVTPGLPGIPHLGFAEAFADAFVADKFSPSTTHWTKLTERVARGVGAPCPLLLIGLPVSAVTPMPPSRGA